MILDAVLLDVAEICDDGDAKPEVTSEEGILLRNPTTFFEMWFTGAFDYGMCTYEHEDQP